MKRLSILGATGSVGAQTLDLIAHHPDRFRVVALTANGRAAELARAARACRAELAVVADPAAYPDLKAALAGSGIEAAAGPDAVIAAAERPADLLVAGIVGLAGLAPVLAAVRLGRVIAFANKECLVSAGPLMVAAVAAHGARLLPVDSEHNAIFQVLDPGQIASVRKITLTASGGPFRDWSLAEMARVTPAQACAHPIWSMGAKISVDSATMMNKGLEVIEAAFLFDLPSAQIDVLVHPQSVIHGLVHYADGSVLAQLGSPDMRTPLAHALAWPERIAAPVVALDLAAIGQLTFAAPDPARFPALALARQALAAGGAAPAILSAANEVAVARFLAGEIGFLEIAAIVANVLDGLGAPPLPDLAALAEIDATARRTAAGA